MEVSVARKAKKIERTLRTDSHPIAHTAAVVLLFLDNLPPSTSYLRAGALTLLGLGPLDAPVKDVIVLVTPLCEGIAEEFTEVRVVRLVVEAEGDSAVQQQRMLSGRSQHSESATLFCCDSNTSYDTCVIAYAPVSQHALPLRRRHARPAH